MTRVRVRTIDGEESLPGHYAPDTDGTFALIPYDPSGREFVEGYQDPWGCWAVVCVHVPDFTGFYCPLARARQVARELYEVGYRGCPWPDPPA
jgi:hypothetical protein